jgi:hypothetical protein
MDALIFKSADDVLSFMDKLKAEHRKAIGFFVTHFQRLEGAYVYHYKPQEALRSPTFANQEITCLAVINATYEDWQLHTV